MAAHVRRRDGISYFDEETTSSRRIRLLECFLFVLLFRFQGAFSRGENEFIKKVRGAALVRTNYYKKFAALLWRKWIYYNKIGNALYHVIREMLCIA